MIVKQARRVSALIVVFLATACGDGGTGPDDHAIPPPGPHYSVSPVPLDVLVRINPLGHNNKILPIGHTYWDVCDVIVLFNEGECNRGRYPIRAPGDGEVWTIEAGPDGAITIEGPPGLFATFSHVTPAAGLVVGDDVRAGDVIAQMFYDHSFDFGILDRGREPHEFLRPERYGDGYKYAENPIEQYPEPLRSQMIAMVRNLGEPFGRLSFDVAGTAQGNWFAPWVPVTESLVVDNVGGQLFLGRLMEREETRILVVGERWTGMPGPLHAVGEGSASWDEITPGDGIVAVKLWEIGTDGRARPDSPRGTVLVELIDDLTLRIEWFDTHDPVGGFTAAARTYDR